MMGDLPGPSETLDWCLNQSPNVKRKYMRNMKVGQMEENRRASRYK